MIHIADLIALGVVQSDPEDRVAKEESLHLARNIPALYERLYWAGIET